MVWSLFFLGSTIEICPKVLFSDDEEMLVLLFQSEQSKNGLIC